jgi:hypothetical protein
MAGGRWHAARVLARRQPVRSRTASGRRYRPRPCGGRSRPRVRGGCVRRSGPDTRPHGDDRRPRWIQGLAHPSRFAPRQARRCGSRGNARRRGGPVRRSRARRPVRPPRRPGGRRRGLRRSAVAPSAVGCPHTSFGTGGPARTGAAGSCSRARAADWCIAASLRARVRERARARARACTDTDANSGPAGDRGVR